MTIHNNLRQLRLNCGMTQEQVAEKIGITRQALSSYESGRTRPDIDMLMRLSHIYGTDLEGILYGQERRLKAVRRIEMTSKILFVLLTVLTLISSAFLWSANFFFPISEGQVSAQEMVIMDAHLRLTGLWEIVDSLILTIAFWGCALLMLFLVTGKGKIQLKRKLKYAAILSAVILLIAIIFGLMDPVYEVVNYMITPVWVVVRFALFLLADIIIENFQRRRLS